MRSKLTTMVALMLAAMTAGAAPLRMGGFEVAPIITGSADAPLQGALRQYMEQQLVRGDGIALTWTAPTSLPRAMESLRNGSIDVLLLTSGKNGDVDGAVIPAWSYLHTQPSLAVRSDSPLRAVQSLDQLAGMEIGWVGGTALNQGMDQIAIHWQFVSATNWQQLNLRKLQVGRIQGIYFENEYSPRYYAQLEHVNIRLLALPVAARNFTMAYSIKADPAAIARFDKAAAAAFAGNQFQAYLEEYMKH